MSQKYAKCGANLGFQIWVLGWVFCPFSSLECNGCLHLAASDDSILLATLITFLFKGMCERVQLALVLVLGFLICLTLFLITLPPRS